MCADFLECLFACPAIHVQWWQIHGNVVVVALQYLQPEVPCPSCHVAATHIHGRYLRYVQDLPCSGQRVRLTVEVRRFQCRNPSCGRRTFSVAPPLVNRYQRHTTRVQTALWHVGLALGGAAGARLVNHLGLVASGDTILLILRHMAAQVKPKPEDASLQHIGIDDWAFRRGHHYGTIVVDLDRRTPVDLLPDRDTRTVATWLSSKCGICTVTRDRSNAYANAISRGAPQALQVADRWHLLRNLGDAIERLLLRRQSDLREAARLLSPPKPIEAPKDNNPAHRSRMQLQVSLQKRSRRLANYQQVAQLRRNGMSISAISRTMKLDRHTVRQWLRAEAFPERACRPPRVSKLAPFEFYLRRRWNEGCHNASVLMREIVDKGYRGGPSILRQRLQEWRRTMPETARGRNIVIPSARSVCAWLLGLEYRSDVEVESRRQFIDLLCKLNPQISESRCLAQDFIAMVRKELPAQLDAWIRHACESGIHELRRFAEGLKQDQAAVDAALTTSYSNGMTEGHDNRLKMIKRQMYGRASLTLLRIRVLHGE